MTLCCVQPLPNLLSEERGGQGEVPELSADSGRWSPSVNS